MCIRDRSFSTLYAHQFCGRIAALLPGFTAHAGEVCVHSLGGAPLEARACSRLFQNTQGNFKEISRVSLLSTSYGVGNIHYLTFLSKLIGVAIQVDQHWSTFTSFDRRFMKVVMAVARKLVEKLMQVWWNCDQLWCLRWELIKISSNCDEMGWKLMELWWELDGVWW